jgi:RNA polymerase sigma factor (sigma-70 family)
VNDETSLIAQSRQGDPAAWETLTRAHQQPVFRLAYLLLGDADDAEDVAQETFIRAYYALDSFDDSRSLHSWLLGIAANQARNHRRAAGRYFSHLLKFARLQPAFSPPMDWDENAHLWKAIQSLKNEFSEILMLRYFFEMSGSEISETLSITPGTVKSRLHRALAALRDVIQRDSHYLQDELV